MASPVGSAVWMLGGVLCSCRVWVWAESVISCSLYFGLQNHHLSGSSLSGCASVFIQCVYSSLIFCLCCRHHPACIMKKFLIFLSASEQLLLCSSDTETVFPMRAICCNRFCVDVNAVLRIA